MQFKSLTLAVAASAMIFGSSMVMAEGTPAAPATQPSEKGEHKKKDMDKSPEQKLRDSLEPLGLTDDQRTKINTVIDDFKKSVDAWEATNKKQIDELKAKREDAKKAKDEAQLKQIDEQWKTLNATRPTTKKLHDDVKAILTADQQAKWEPKGEGKGEGKHEGKEGKKHDAK